MCGIAGFADRDRAEAFAHSRNEAEFGLVHRMCDVIRHRGPGRRGNPCRAGRRSRHAAAEHHRPVHGAAADPQRGSHDLARVQRRDLQLPRAARRARGARPRASTPSATPRSIVHAYEAVGRGGVRPAARHVRHRALGSTPPHAAPRARSRRASSRCTTPSGTGGCTSASEIKSLLAAGAVDREIDLEALDHYLSFSVRAARRARSSRASASCRPGHLLRWRDGRAELSSVLGSGALPSRSREPRRRRRRRCAASWPTPCARTWSATCRSAPSSPAASTRASSSA